MQAFELLLNHAIDFSFAPQSRNFFEEQVILTNSYSIAISAPNKFVGFVSINATKGTKFLLENSRIFSVDVDTAIQQHLYKSLWHILLLQKISLCL